MATRPLPPTLLPSLNALLAALALPFALDHPTDLAPSLLLAIFESLIGARLPIPSSVRQSRTRDAKARAMLVLLGVLECDVLRGGEHAVAADDSVLSGGVSVDGWVDEIGLGEVDPERLADGGWDETIFVGELLCWLARRKGILPRTSFSHRASHPRSLYSNHHSYGTEQGEGDTADFSTSLLLRPARAPQPRSPSPAHADFSALSHITDVPRHPLVHSPEPSLSASATTGTDLSIRARSVSSRTSVSNTRDDPDEFDHASQDTVQTYDPRRMMQDADEDDDRPPTFRPRCIHELEDPSYIRALAEPSSSFGPSASHERLSEDGEDDPQTPTPRRVRLTGWIDPIDAAAEFSHFAASRAHSRSRVFNTTAGSGPSQTQPQPHKHARTGGFSNSTPRLTSEVSPRPRPGQNQPRTSRRASPSPSPPPSPPPASSKHPPPRAHPSPPPSPPAHSDPPFDVSFSTLNNTSTPAKPRPPRRPPFQTTTRHEIESDTRADRGTGGGSVGTGTQTARPRRRDRSPSYTPSPPSFSTSGGRRSAASGTTGFSARVGAPTASAVPSSTTATRQKSMRSTPPSATSAKGKSPPPVVPPGSTATTNTLLTERARLLTELAALKRARAASGAGIGTGTGTGTGTGSGGGGGGVVGRRVGVGV